MPQPPSLHSAQQVQPHSVLDQVRGVFPDLETETLLEPHGPKHAGRVLDEAQVVKHPDRSVLDVPSSAEKIQQLAEVIRIEAHGQGVHGEIPAIHIQLDGTEFDGGQGRRAFVVFRASGGDVHLESVGKDKNGRLELFVGAVPASSKPRIIPREFDAVAFHDDVHIEVVPPEEHVPDETAYDERLDIEPVGDASQIPKHFREVPREPSRHDLQDIFALVGGSRMQSPEHVLFPPDALGLEIPEDVRPGHRSNEPVPVHDRHEALGVIDDDPLHVGNGVSGAAVWKSVVM